MSSNWGAGPASEARRMMEYDARKKSAGVAYLIWFFLGGFGGHRFYLGRTGSAVAMLVISLASWLLVAVGVGLIGLAVIGIWALVDAFLIPGMVRDDNLKVMNSIA